jgi:hypothetical protein
VRLVEVATYICYLFFIYNNIPVNITIANNRSIVITFAGYELSPLGFAITLPFLSTSLWKNKSKKATMNLQILYKYVLCLEFKNKKTAIDDSGLITTVYFDYFTLNLV